MKQSRVLVGGRMGTGKSTVARMLGAYGGCVISSDEVGHVLLESGGEISAQVMKRWPEVVHDDHIDRSRLGAVVFSDHLQLRELEDILHPAIRSRIRDLVNHCAERFVVVEVPLLADLVYGDWARLIVDAPDLLCRSRLYARGLSDSEIDGRWAMQPSRAEWLHAADICLSNKGDLTDLEQAVHEAAQRLGLIDA